MKKHILRFFCIFTVITLSAKTAVHTNISVANSDPVTTPIADAAMSAKQQDATVLNNSETRQNTAGIDKGTQSAKNTETESAPASEEVLPDTDTRKNRTPLTVNQTPVSKQTVISKSIQGTPHTVLGLPSSNTIDTTSGSKVLYAEKTVKENTLTTTLQPASTDPESEPKPKKLRAFSMHSGITLGVQAANNLISIPRIFQKEIMFDMTKIASLLGGIQVSANADFAWFLRFSVLETHTVRFSVTAVADVWVQIPQEFVKVVAEGNVNPENKTVTRKGTFYGKANLMADLGLTYQFTKPKYSVSARLNYFVPLAHLKNKLGEFRLETLEEGIQATITGEPVLYSAYPFNNTGNIRAAIKKALQNGGFDMGLGGSYRPADWVNILFKVSHLPLKPAMMDSGIIVNGNASGQVKNILGIVQQQLTGSKPDEQNSWNYKIKKLDTNYKIKKAEKVMRMSKIAVAADFKPFSNNYLIVQPMLALPIIGATPYYADAGVKITTRYAADVLGASYDLSYIDRVWQHRLSLFIDSRFFTFNLDISLHSHSFTRTFYTLSGAGLRLGFGIGF